MENECNYSFFRFVLCVPFSKVVTNLQESQKYQFKLAKPVCSVLYLQNFIAFLIKIYNTENHCCIFIDYGRWFVTQGDNLFHWHCFYNIQYPFGEQAFAVSNRKSMEMKPKG